MKKNLKRTLAKVMAVALTVSMVGVASDDVDAAKKIKLSKKTISVVKGKTKKVTIKNVKAKKVKKLTVKSKDKKIATVKKAGKTAIKVTGKKAGKSTKITVKVTLKGKKKATKLTLKVKVTKAKKVTPEATANASATPTASASATPGTSASPSVSPSVSPSTSPSATPSATPATSATPASGAPATDAPATDAPGVVKEALKVKIDPSTQSSLIKKDYYKDAVFYKEGAYSFVSTNAYNTGLGISVNEDASLADVSQYKYIKVILDCEVEVAVNLYDSSATSYWEKVDVYEGNGDNGAVVTDKSKLTGLRAVYVPLSRFADRADLEEIACVSVNPNGKEGARITVYSIEFTDDYLEDEKIDVPSTLTPIDAPAPSTEPSAAPSTSSPTASASEAPEASKAPETSEAPEASKAPAASTEPAGETPVIEFTAPETASVETGATVSFKVTNDTAAVETAIWEVSDDADVDVEEDDCTKATITSKKEGVVTVTVAITLANGKKATKTTEIKFVKDATEPVEPEEPDEPEEPKKETPDINVELTDDTVVKVKAYGADPQLTVADGVVTKKGKDDACMGIKITIPEGYSLSDYYGITFDVMNTSSDEINGKRFLVEAKGNDAENLTRVTGKDGSTNINIFKSEQVNGLAVGDTTTLTGEFKNLDTITYDLTGTVTLALDSNFQIDGGYAIKNVKLLAKDPAAK